MNEVKKFLDNFINWTKTQNEIIGVILVGSHARGVAKSDSDIDLVIITEDPEVYLEDDNWIKVFGEVKEIKNENYKLVQSRRTFYENGLEVEYGITEPKWVNTNPVDKGTERVILDGARILYDKKGTVEKLFTIIGKYKTNEE